MRPRALVTGASSGIGQAFARSLASRGQSLVLVARRESRLEALAQQLESQHGVSSEVLAADLLEPDGLARVEERAGAADIGLLVNNAGFGGPGAFADQDITYATQILRLNCEALMRLTHAALGPMRARGDGAIVQVASLAAFQPSPYFAVYAATKAFVLSFSEAVHEEVRLEGVKVLTVCPGFTRTEFQTANEANAEFLPEALWSRPDQIVETTLRSLDRTDAVLIPRWHDWLSASFSTMAPRKLVVAGAVGRKV